MSLSDLGSSKTIQNQKDQLLYHESDLFMIWNILLSLVLLWQIIMLPQDILLGSYIVIDTENSVIFEILFEWFYLFDIMVATITVQYDEYGNLITDLDQIIIGYLSGWFVIDTISSIPIKIFQLVSDTKQSQNSYISPSMLKILKLGKTIRGLKVMKRLLQTTAVDQLIDFLDTIGMYNILHKYQKMVLMLFMFFFTCWVLVCWSIQQIQINPKNNWFKSMIQDDQLNALSNPAHRWFNEANMYGHENQDRFQEYILKNDTLSDDYFLGMNHMWLQAWQFVIQTATTVGYGDVSSVGLGEKIMRCFCMFLGSLLQSAFSASIVELVIFENIENTEFRSRTQRIKEIVSTQNLKSEPRKVINQLSTSVYEYKLKDEQSFINLLPESYSYTVLKTIQVLQSKKINMIRLEEDNYKFFIEVFKNSSYRKCIENEVIIKLNDEINLIYFVYSGKLGVNAPKLNAMFDSIINIGMGEEFGQNSFMSDCESLLEITCSSDTELLCMSKYKFVAIYLRQALKGNIQFIIDKVKELLVDLFMMLIMNNLMIRVGLYNDSKWNNRIMKILQVKDSDKKMIEKVVNSIMNEDDQDGAKQIQQLSISRKNEKLKKEGKWYDRYISMECIKQVNKKITNIYESVIDENLMTLYNEQRSCNNNN